MKRKLTREEQRKYEKALVKYLKAVEKAEAEHREKRIRARMQFEKDSFLFGGKWE